MPLIACKNESDWEISDSAGVVVDTLGAETYECVMAAMRAGLTEFTTPTPSKDWGRIDWIVRKWVIFREGRPVCFLVAQNAGFAHMEVIGNEVPLELDYTPTPTHSVATTNLSPTEFLQRRAKFDKKQRKVDEPASAESTSPADAAPDGSDADTKA